jgi:hypothetical protein
MIWAISLMGTLHERVVKSSTHTLSNNLPIVSQLGAVWPGTRHWNHPLNGHWPVLTDNSWQFSLLCICTTGYAAWAGARLDRVQWNHSPFFIWTWVWIRGISESTTVLQWKEFLIGNLECNNIPYVLSSGSSAYSHTQPLFFNLTHHGLFL